MALLLSFIGIVILSLQLCQATEHNQLTSDVDYNGRNVACLGQTVTFQCQVADTSLLDWVAEPFINSSDPIRFVPSDSVMTTETRGQFMATITDISPSSSNPQFADMTSTLTFPASEQVDGTVIECSDDSTQVNDIIHVTGIPPQPTDFVCSDVTCESGDSVTVQCQWKIPESSGTEVIFFTVYLPDEITVTVPGNQNDLIFNTTCQSDTTLVVAISSNCNTSSVIYVINRKIAAEVSLAPVAAVAAVIPVAVIIIILLYVALIKMNQDLKFEEHAQQSVTIRWKLHVPFTQQHLSVFQLENEENDRSLIVPDDDNTVSGTSRDVELSPGGHYRAVLTITAGCLLCHTFGESTSFFLTKVNITSTLNDHLVVCYNQPSSESDDIAVEFECSAKQPIKVIWHMSKQSDGRTCTKKIEEISSTGERRWAKLDISKLDKASGMLSLNVEIKTLPTSGRDTSDLKKCLVTIPQCRVTVKVFPKSPYGLEWTHETGILSWKQDHETEDEKPTKFSLEVDGSHFAEIIGPDCQGTASYHVARLPVKPNRVEISAVNNDGRSDPTEFTPPLERRVTGERAMVPQPRALNLFFEPPTNVTEFIQFVPVGARHLLPDPLVSLLITNRTRAHTVQFRVIYRTATRMIVQWEVRPTPPNGSTLVVKEVRWHANKMKKSFKAFPNDEVENTVTINGLEPDKTYTFRIDVEEKSKCGRYSTLKFNEYNASLEVLQPTEADYPTVKWELVPTPPGKATVKVMEMGEKGCFNIDPIATMDTSPAALTVLKPNTTYIVLLFIDGVGEAIDCCSFTTAKIQASQLKAATDKKLI